MSLFNKQILCVGTNSTSDKLLQAEIAGMHPQWSARFANGGREALKALTENRYDAVVVDVHLPDMDGFGFLNLLQERHPKIHRVIVSELSHRESALKCVGLAH